VTSEIKALGGQLMVADHVREPELRRTGIKRAKAVVILGGDGCAWRTSVHRSRSGELAITATPRWG
jgi:hypothetical protein